MTLKDKQTLQKVFLSLFFWRWLNWTFSFIRFLLKSSFSSFYSLFIVIDLTESRIGSSFNNVNCLKFTFYSFCVKNGESKESKVSIVIWVYYPYCQDDPERRGGNQQIAWLLLFFVAAIKVSSNKNKAQWKFAWAF